VKFEDYIEGVRFLIKDLKERNILTILDAIEVEDKFKIAIETALGEISNYVIVNDSKDVDGMIRELSENKKGKVTFILNDQLNYKEGSEIFFLGQEPDFIKNKGVYGFADKYVKCVDKKYQLLMRYILDEYIIVDNLETAKVLAEDNYYKFITLDGDILTKGFIHAGGNANQESVRLGREKKIAELNLEVSGIKDLENISINEHKNIKSRFDAINIESFKKAFESINTNISDIENEISKIDFKNDQLGKVIQDNETSYGIINGSNKTLNELINSLIEEVKKSENEQYNLDKELIFLTDEFNIIEQNYSQESVDYNNFNVEFIKLKNELINDEQNLSRTKNTISYNERKFSENTLLIESSEKDSQEHSIRLNENQVKLEGLNAEVDIISSEYDIEKGSLDVSRSEQHKTDVGQRQRRIDFDSISQKLINAQIKIKENEIKSEQIKDYILKKYEKDISYTDEEENPEAAYHDFDHIEARKSVDGLAERLKSLGGGYQQILFEDFENEKEELRKLVEQKEDLLESEKDIRKTIERINKEARERFLGTFERIRENFITIFKELFTEGDEANLRIIYEEDEDGKLAHDPLEAKIEIIAKPRGKRPTSIELLSGGEKTLTAIALLFAIYLVKPSPFCVLDEVDAPLDVANLSRFNKMIRKFSENTQFILITHNERTMESVDRLYGVTMQEAGVTTIVETKFKTDEKLHAEDIQ
ncbi:MAG: hypothetical protein ABI528_07735, partial [bacterium]